jgi:hypothetical protein
MGYQREKVARDLLDVEQSTAGTHATWNPRAGRTPGTKQRRPSMGYQREKVARDLLDVEQSTAGTHAT